MKNSYFKKIVTIIFVIVLLAGCNVNNDQAQELLDELNSENLQLKEQLNKSEEDAKEVEEKINVLTSELEIAQVEIEDLKTELKDFEKYNDEDMQLMDYLKYYNGRILTSDFQPVESMAILNTSKGLRTFPNEGAPYFYQDKITYEEHETNGRAVIVHAYYNGRLENGWAFITYDYFASGFVLVSELETYTYEKSYEPSEQFKDFKIGINKENIYEYFGKDLELINDRNTFGHVIRVNNIEDESLRDIDFWYHPGDDRVAVINTNSDKYPLESGFKVGDKAEDVFAYYDQLYEESEYFSSERYKRYDIGDGYSLDFNVVDGIVVFIMINGGLYSYA